MKITLEVSEENEGTRAPWWMIVKPQQNFHTCNRGIANIAMGITGPFFSREEAEKELEGRRYYYGKNAKVWCASGHASRQYCKAWEKAEREKEVTQ